MKIALGSDHIGYPLKEKIKQYLTEQKITFVDLGTFSDQPVDYPDYALKVAEEIKQGKCDRGILICGMGLGMCITANKIPGIYAARCHDRLSARKARESNNAQILTMGSLLIRDELARKIVKAWLSAEYLGRSDLKLEKIKNIEKKYLK